MNNPLFGREGESEAAKFLTTNGYRIIERNYEKKFGEIDLVAMDGDTLCFIEVKTRDGLEYGHPFEALTISKQRNIRKLAKVYLMEKEIEDTFIRFDVVGILWNDQAVPQIELLKNAF